MTEDLGKVALISPGRPRLTTSYTLTRRGKRLLAA
jgi:hypothetical protein